MVTATVTAALGPGDSLTAKVFEDVKGLNFDYARNVFTLTHGSNYIKTDFSFEGIATVTTSFSGSDIAITIS